jgi:uncharacterized membrane protein YeaQ/YmgE (transglycosylase-associated protein family)
MKSNLGLIMNIVLGIVGAAIASAILSALAFRLHRCGLADLDRPCRPASLRTSEAQ